MKHNHSYRQWKQNISITIHAYMDQHLTCITSFINEYYYKHKLGKNTYLIKNLFRIQLRHYNVPPNHKPACSLISQQRCHPRARHDSPRNEEQAGLHVARDTQNIAKPTQLGLSGHIGARKA